MTSLSNYLLHLRQTEISFTWLLQYIFMQTEHTKNVEGKLARQHSAYMWKLTLLSFWRKKYLRISVDLLKLVRKVLTRFDLSTFFEMPPVVCDTWLRASVDPAVSIMMLCLLYSRTVSQLTFDPPKRHTLNFIFFDFLCDSSMSLSVCEIEHS